MKVGRILWFIAAICMVIQQPFFLNSTRAQTYSQFNLDPARIPWVRLRYDINNFPVGVTTQVFLESLQTADIEAALIESHQGVMLKPSSPTACKITLRRIVDSILKPPVKTINHVWFNPHDATALGRVRLQRGDDDFKKVYRFTDQGVFRHRRQPKGKQEISRQPEKWTDIKDTFYTYNLNQLGCPTVSERLVLMYIVSAAEISKSTKPLSLCVFGKRQLFHVQLRPEGLHSLKVDFIEKRQQTENRRQGKVESLKIALEVQPLLSDLSNVENFSFLGLQQDIAIFIDPVSNLPVQISGKIPKVGEVTVKLIEVYLRKPCRLSLIKHPHK